MISHLWIGQVVLLPVVLAKELGGLAVYARLS